MLEISLLLTLTLLLAWPLGRYMMGIFSGQPRLPTMAPGLKGWGTTRCGGT